MPTSEPLSDQEHISSLNNQPEEPEEEDNSEKANTVILSMNISILMQCSMQQICQKIILRTE